jgi:hypothetical protein
VAHGVTVIGELVDVPLRYHGDIVLDLAEAPRSRASVD